MPVRRDVVHEHPARVLAAYAGRADLVVIGRHSRGHAIGGIQHAVLSHARGPVAIVPDTAIVPGAAVARRDTGVRRLSAALTPRAGSPRPRARRSRLTSHFPAMTAAARLSRRSPSEGAMGGV